MVDTVMATGTLIIVTNIWDILHSIQTLLTCITSFLGEKLCSQQYAGFFKTQLFLILVPPPPHCCPSSAKFRVKGGRPWVLSPSNVSEQLDRDEWTLLETRAVLQKPSPVFPQPSAPTPRLLTQISPQD